MIFANRKGVRRAAVLQRTYFSSAAVAVIQPYPPIGGYPGNELAVKIAG